MITRRIALIAMALMVGVVTTQAEAKISDSLESLGSNPEVEKRAARVGSRNRVSIVQNRAVDRNWRLELGVNYGPVAAGDSYLRTQNLGGQVELHVTPRFSLGVRYAQAFNSLTPEGKQQFEAARNAKSRGAVDYRVPDIDYPKEQLFGTLTWYMMYGKINFFDLSVVQFDIYSLAGYGQVTLSSGNTDTWTAGGGVGFWFTKHITSRFEMRYQTYADQVYTGARNLDLIVANFGLGVLL